MLHLMRNILMEKNANEWCLLIIHDKILPVVSTISYSNKQDQRYLWPVSIHWSHPISFTISGGIFIDCSAYDGKKEYGVVYIYIYIYIFILSIYFLCIHLLERVVPMQWRWEYIVSRKISLYPWLSMIHYHFYGPDDSKITRCIATFQVLIWGQIKQCP